jgi:hypothetical protein
MKSIILEDEIKTELNHYLLEVARSRLDGLVPSFSDAVAKLLEEHANLPDIKANAFKEGYEQAKCELQIEKEASPVIKEQGVKA